MVEFRIVDLREPARAECTETHITPQGAASRAYNLKLVRAGHPSRLVCKVYWSDGTNTNMVRLYEAAH
ncbi:hypothetical protein [Devosia sediminis]|uniref:Uncharacterized protein n=1 Tax=Devosia sediminis TaxID=2798801 RepID=A0A934MPZ4_9HYPH|nr:hypothetical protein [Devosia sediminis]MBJ3783844.1 hypothetical protein [Devosia sediminis]